MAWYKLFSSGKSGVDAACGHIKTCKNVSSSSKIQYANLGTEFTTYLTGIKTAVETVEGSTVAWTDLATKIASFTTGSSEPVVDPTPEATLTSITATKTVTTYTVGDTIRYDDITVTGHYSDNTTAQVTSYTITDMPNTDSSGTKSIMIYYLGKSCTINIVVEEATEPIEEPTETPAALITALKNMVDTGFPSTYSTNKLDTSSYGYGPSEITSIINDEVVPLCPVTATVYNLGETNGVLVPVEYADSEGNATYLGESPVVCTVNINDTLKPRGSGQLGNETVTYTFANVKNAIQSKYTEFMALVDPAMTTLDKIILVHEYLVYGWTYNNSSTLYKRTWGWHTIINKVGQCVGMMRASQALLRWLGIKSVLIGNSGHAWNAVLLDGNWYLFDNTWDNTRARTNPDSTTACDHMFLLNSTSKFQSGINGSTHWADTSRSEYKNCTSKIYDNWFVHDIQTKMTWDYNNHWWTYELDGNTYKCYSDGTMNEIIEPEEEPIVLEPTLDSISAHLVGNVNNNVVYGSSGPDYSQIRVTLHYAEEDEPDAVISTGFAHTNLNTNVVGTQNITITYNNKTCTLAYNVYAVPSSFVFNPTKTAFYLNETVGDCYGTATVTMNDGTTQTWINNNGIQYTGWIDTSSLKDDGFVEVALRDYSSIPVQSFTYTVSEPWTTGVSIDKVRRGYSVNDVVDTFDVSVTKHLCNGTTATADASEYTITADTTTESGVKELSVTCEGYEDEVEFGVTEAKTNGVKSSTYGTDRYEYGAEIIWADDRPNAYNAFCIQYNDKNHSTRTVTPLSEMIESGTVIVGDPKVESTSVTGCSKVTRNFYWRGQCFTHVGYQYAFNQATDDVYIEFPNGNVIDMSDTDSLLMEDFLKKVTGTNDVYYMDSTTDGYLDSATVDSSTVLPADYPIRAYTIKNGMKIDVTFHMFDKGSLFSAYDFLEQMYSKVFNDLCNNVVSENNNDDMTPVKITLNWNDTYYGETYLTNDCEDAYRVTSTISSGMTSYDAALPIRYHFTFTIKPTQADYPEQFYTPVTVTDDSYGNGYSFSKFNPSQCYMVNVTDTSDSVHKLMVINYNTDCHTDTSDDDEIITYDEVSDTDAGGRTYILSSDDGFHTYEVVHEWYSSNDDTTPTTFNVSTWATTNGFAVASVSIDSDQNAREYLESDSRPAFNRFAFRLPEIVKNSAHGAYHTYTCTANSHTYQYLVFLRPKTGNSISLTVEEGSLPGYIQPKYIPNVDSWIYIFCSVDGGWTWRRMYKLNVPEEYSVTGGTGVQLTAVFNETGNVTAYVKISSSGVGSTVYTWSTDNVTTF